MKVAREDLWESRDNSVRFTTERSWGSRNVGCQLELGRPCPSSSGLTPARPKKKHCSAFIFCCLCSAILCYAPYLPVKKNHNCKLWIFHESYVLSYITFFWINVYMLNRHVISSAQMPVTEPPALNTIQLLLISKLQKGPWVYCTV